MARRNLAVKLASLVITAPITLVVVLFAVSPSNREPVSLELWPLPGGLDVPLYLVALLALAVGFVLGGIIAWTGELGHKRRAARAERRVEDLEREIAVMRIREEEIRAQAGSAPTRPALVDRRVA